VIPKPVQSYNRQGGLYNSPMTPASRLVQWFAANARKLPWRTEPRDPWAVLVSELMLQQTQAARVAERYPVFLERFPSPEVMAAASEDEVVAAWSGLGYYRRARALHRLARSVAGEGRGLPSTAAELEGLPGIGPYTAAAVASLAHGEAVPVLDGNVLRVGARVLELHGDPRRAVPRRTIGSWVLTLMEDEAPATVNEALMELGATVCLPATPRCAGCPFAPECRALAVGRQETIPPPRAVRSPEQHRWVAAIVVNPSGRWLLRRIEGGSVLRGLWLPPLDMEASSGETGSRAAALIPFPLDGGRSVEPVRHSITHRRIEVQPVVFSVGGDEVPGAGWRWEDPADPTVATSSLPHGVRTCRRRPLAPHLSAVPLRHR